MENRTTGCKKKIIIWGIGESLAAVEESLRTDNVEIVCYLDNDREKQQSLHQGKEVCTLQKAALVEYDYIVIAIVNYHSCIGQLTKMGLQMEKVIPFYSDELFGKEDYADILDMHKWELKALQQKFNVEIKKIRTEFTYKLNNIKYEIAENIQKKSYSFPLIESSEKALNSIIENRYSICRFGDGEFEMMREKKRPKFQLPDKKLADRLKEIIRSKDEKILIGLADNYGSLSAYTEDAANGIRKYLTPETRAYHMSAIDSNKKYYNAYLFRPYIMYEDRQKAVQQFALIRQIWDDRQVTIIEGDRSRLGEDNNLLSNAKEIKRITAPSTNAFSEYESILERALKIDKEELVLITLGPAATVLAYDLAREGYQAIDIGQIDNEYDWFQRQAEQRIPINGKYVSEISSIYQNYNC